MRSSFGIAVLLALGTAVLVGSVAGAGCTVLTNDALPDDAGRFEAGDATSSVCATCLANACTGQWAACLTDPSCAALARCAANPATCVCASNVASDAGNDAGEADASDASIANAPFVHGAYASCNAVRARPGGECTTDCAGTNFSSNMPCAVIDGGATDSGTSDADASNDAAAVDAAADDAGDASVVDAAANADAGPTPSGVTVDGCTGCVAGKCGDAKKACAIGTECAKYLECVYGAADLAAADECGRQHASGKTAAVELATCTRVSCGEACGF